MQSRGPSGRNMKCLDLQSESQSFIKHVLRTFCERNQVQDVVRKGGARKSSDVTDWIIGWRNLYLVSTLYV